MTQLDFSQFTDNIDFQKICKDFENAFLHRKKSPTRRVFSKFVDFLLPKDIDPIIDLADSVDFHGTDKIFDNLEDTYNKLKQKNVNNTEIGKELLNNLVYSFCEIDNIKPKSLQDFKNLNSEKKGDLAQKILEYRSKILKPIKIRINRVFKENSLPAPLKDRLGKSDNEYISDEKIKELILKDLEDKSASETESYAFSSYKLKDISTKLSEADLVKQKNKENLSKSKKLLSKIIKSFSFIAAIGEAASFVSLFVFLLMPYLGGPVFILAVPLGLIMGVSAKYFFDTQVYEVAVDFLERFYKGGFNYSLSLNTLYTISVTLLGITSSAILGYIAFLSGGALWSGIIGSGMASQMISGLIASIGFLSSCFFITSSLETILSLEQFNTIRNYIDKTFINPWVILYNEFDNKTAVEFTSQFCKTTFRFLYKSCLSLGILAAACFGAMISFEGIEKALSASALIGKMNTYLIYGLSSLPVISLFFSSVSKAKLVSEYVEYVPSSLSYVNTETQETLENNNEETEITANNDNKTSSTFREEYLTWVQRATNLMTFSFVVNAFSEISSKHLSFVNNQNSSENNYSNEIESLIENIKKTSVMEAFTTTEAIMGLAGYVKDTKKVKSSSILESKHQNIASELRMAASEENLSSSRRFGFNNH